MNTEEKPLCCRACGALLALSTPTSLRTQDGIELIFGKTIVLRCTCGKEFKWHRVSEARPVSAVSE